MLETLDHIVVATADLDQAERQAVALLGRTPAWAGRHSALGTRNAVFRLANTALELVAPDGEGPGADALRDWLDGRSADGLMLSLIHI